MRSHDDYLRSAIVPDLPIVDSAADLLREARRRAGLTQAELGRRAGVAQSVISAYESGGRQPSLPVLLDLVAATGHALDASLVPARGTRPLSGPLGRRVKRHREQLRATAMSYGASDVRVFGSVARGDEHPDSDVDLLVTLSPGTGLFALGRLRRDLEAILAAPVDVVPEEGLKPSVRESVERELVSL